MEQVIKMAYCPDVVDNALTKPKQPNVTYNEEVHVQCLGGLPLYKAYGSSAMRKSPGRAITYTCGAHAEWEGPDVECWKGQTVDIQNNESLPSILALNTPTLFYCDVTGKDNYDVIMTVGTQRFSQKNNVAAILTLGVKDFNKTAECFSQRDVSSKKQVSIWFLFPPQVLNRQTFVHYLCVGDASTAIVTFRSNPPITECGEVRVNKQGISFTSFVVYSSGVTNFIQLIFPKLSKSDLGYYDVMVTSCTPVFSKKTIHIEIKECNTPVAVVTVHKTDSRFTIGLSTACACLMLLLIAVTCIAVKRRNNGSNSSGQPGSETPRQPAMDTPAAPPSVYFRPNASNACNAYGEQQAADYCVIPDRKGYVNMPLPGSQQSHDDPRFQGGASLDAGAYESYFIPG